MRVFITCLFLVFCFRAVAQKNGAPKRGQFFSANSIALLRGEAGAAFGAQSVNGWRWGLWGGGMGVGWDGYQKRSAPLFAQLQLHLAHTQFSVYGSAGRNLVVNKAKADWTNGNKAEKNGRYLEAGLQYNWQLHSKQALIFSVGYAEKTYRETQTVVNPCLTGACPEEENVWHYTFRRIALRAGWQF